MTPEKQIKCPKCGELISVDDVLTRQIEERVRKELEESEKDRELKIRKKEIEMKEKIDRIEKEKKELDLTIAKKVAIQIAEEKVNILKIAKLEAEKEQDVKVNFLNKQLEDKNKKLEEAAKKEIELIKQKMDLDESKKRLELENIREIEEIKKKITEEASKEATEKQQYIIAQLRKQLSDATKAKDDLARKLEQGSQQTQGEVLELELEEILKAEFLYDEIVPVQKGVKGADIIQSVKNRSGNLCGQIVWEFKKTKTWSEGWIQKLKEDQRTAKAEIAVIVSMVLPEDVKGFMFRDGVWICDIKLIKALATALRMNLESIAREKTMSVGKSEKMEILYTYLTGVEFKQRIEAIVEAFSSMDEGLKKERMAYEKIWAEREKQIKKVMNNTIGMYGDLSGLVTLPQIKTLELPSGEK